MKASDNLVSRLKDLTGSDNGLMLGRGTTALALALRAIRLMSQKTTIIMPAISCAALPQVALYEGFKISYCDVNLTNLGFDVEQFSKKKFDDVAAVLVVYQFGMASDIDLLKNIVSFKSSHRVFFIEDICQAFGGTFKSSPLGSKSDFSISSFGGGKIVSVSSGGGFLGVRGHDCFEAVTDSFLRLSLNSLDPKIQAHLSLSHRNFYHSVVDLKRIKVESQLRFSEKIVELYRKLYYVGYNHKSTKLISSGLANLSENLRDRLMKAQIYAEHFTNIESIKLFDWSGSGCLWRFILLVRSADDQYMLTSALRRQGYDVSNHYWSLPDIFGKNGSYGNTEYYQERVLNLWVDATYDNKKARMLAQDFRRIFS